MAVETTEVASAPEVGLPVRWPARRMAAWVLIAIGILGFLLAGGVRTAWVIGDIQPDRGEVALPRLATIAVLIGLVLLARHQVIARRSLPNKRYRGPSVLVILVLIAGLSMFLTLPLRRELNLAFEGGIPSLVPVVVMVVAMPLAAIAVTWLVLHARPLPGERWFRDAHPIRHALIGVSAGGAFQVVAFVYLALTPMELSAPILQASTPPLPGPWFPGQPLWLAAVSAIMLAPLSEELFFRGLALRAWTREYGPWFAVVASALLFGLVHYGLNPLEGLWSELPWLIPPAVAGLFLGVLALRTGTLVAPIAAHATMNAVTLVLILILGGPTGIA